MENSKTTLFEAILAGDRKAVQEIIETQNIDVNTLELCKKYRDIAMLFYVINFNIKEKSQITSSVDLFYKQLTIFPLLLKLGVEVFPSDKTITDLAEYLMLLKVPMAFLTIEINSNIKDFAEKMPDLLTDILKLLVDGMVKSVENIDITRENYKNFKILKKCFRQLLKFT